MNKKLSVIVILGCLFIIVNMGLASIPSEFLNVELNDSSNQDFLLKDSESKDIDIEIDGVLDDNKKSIENREIWSRNTDTYHANAGGPYSAKTNEKIEFDGSNSYLAHSKIITYKWDFGDGCEKYGKQIDYSYSSPGVYYATLTITDSNGFNYQDLTPVYVNQDNNHLFAYGGCFYNADVDEEIIFDGSLSLSENPDLEITKWIWHLGDGTTKEGEKVTHSYSENRVYLVTLEIEDEKGNTRLDVLHADIGCSYSSFEDFFKTSNTKIKSTVDILFNKIGSFILYPLLFVKIYTNYNGYEQTIPLSNSYILPLSIDVNYDGDEDIVVNEISFFKPTLSDSPFNNQPWFAFESTISDIEIISDDIKLEDDFSICLQFSIQILEDFLGIKEPVVRIGYHSSSGEEKPDDFSATHIFRPYLLNKIFSQENNVVENLQVKSSEKQTKKYQIISEASEVGVLTINKPKSISSIISKDHSKSSLKDDFGQEIVKKKGITDNNGTEPIPENGLRVNSSNVDKFSLVLSLSNVIDTTKTSFELTFESFTETVMTHRRGQTYSDVDFKGTDNSSITLSVTRVNQQGSATLGIYIDPVQNCGFSIDIGKLQNDGRHIAFNIENPPENIALFAKAQDLRNDSNSLFFYLRNIPNTIDFEWIPRLDDGYITLTKEFDDDELIIGVCDDLKKPDSNLYLSNLPTETSVNWDISSETPRTLAFSSDTDGLTLNVELNDVTQENQTVDFQATSNEDIDIKLFWNLQDGYFELQRSTKNINFDFLLSQDDLALNVNGNYQGGSDEGFVVDFNGLTQGTIELQSDKSLDLSINYQDFEKETSLQTDLEFLTAGNIQLAWDENINANFNGSAKFGLNNFLLNSTKGHIGAQEISLEENTDLSFQIDQDAELQISGIGEFTFTQFEGEIGYWSNNIDELSIGGSYNIKFQPLNKYYEFQSTQSIFSDGFNFEYDGPGNENDFILAVDAIEISSGGTSWFDFSSDTPEFNLESNYYIYLVDFHLGVGTGSSSVIDFTLSSAYINQQGTISGEWTSEYLYIDAAVNFDWELAISSLNFGDWETYGDIDGSASVLAQWQSGSGNITFDIGESGLSHDFEVVHDDLTLNLGTMDLEPGDITFEWQREDNPTNGYFKILNNGIIGDLTLCKITYDDDENPFEFELGTITLDSGNLFVEWSRQTVDKFIYIDNEITIDMDIVSLSWDDKTVALEDLIFSPGEFRFYWNYVDKIVEINNGINGLGPSISYEDDNREISLSLTDLQDDYSKTMTAKWYEDSDDNVSGLYLDTEGTNLIDWIEFSYVKYDTSGNTGRKIALGGLQADDFKIEKNEDNNVDISGRIYLANHLTYSKLVSDEWRDLDIQWDIDLDGIGEIEFSADPVFNVGIELSSKFSGVNINTTFDLPDYVKITWDIDFDGEGYIGIDTDSEEIYEMDFWFYKNTAQYQPKWGLYLNCLGIIAEDYVLSWDFNEPPGSWIMQESGYIEPGSLNDMNIAWNGNWFNAMAQGTPI